MGRNTLIWFYSLDCEARMHFKVEEYLLFLLEEALLNTIFAVVFNTQYLK